MSHYSYENINFIYYYYSLHAEKISIMPALCSILRLWHNAQNYASNLT